MIFTTRDTQKNLLEAVSLLQTKVVDGAIFMTTHQAERQISELNRDYPIVCACEPVADPEIPCVVIDNVRASYEATRYLLETASAGLRCWGLIQGCLTTPFRENWSALPSCAKQAIGKR